MNQITKEALEFLNEAKKQLSENSEWTTYRDENENFIALRTGLFEDSIFVYELGNPVGNFVEQLPRQQKVVIDYDQLEQYKSIGNKILPMLDKVATLLTDDPEDDYHYGYKAALEYILKHINSIKENE
jgi:hypothetical protein